MRQYNILTDIYQIFQDLSERRDESCQTDAKLQPIGLDDKQKKQIEKEAREAAKQEFNKILEEERKQHQIEVKKLKKKQWCAMCLKEGKAIKVIQFISRRFT